MLFLIENIYISPYLMKREPIMMIYFDNAATTLQKPESVVQAVKSAMDTFGNASRASHRAALQAARTLYMARKTIADYFGCNDAQAVVFTKNATEALNIAIQAIEGPLVSSEAEHNSVLRPALSFKDTTLVPVDEKGCICLNQLFEMCTSGPKNVKAVVLGHASNLTGNVVDIEAVGRFCRKNGLLFIVDAAQTAGLLPIDMQAMCIDALCFTGHKSLFGPQGTGGLCLSERFLPSALMVGGSGSHSFSHLQPEELPDRLEAGTLNGHGIAGLLAGVRYLQEQKEKPREKTIALERLFYKQTKEIKGIQFYGDMEAPCRAPVVSLNLPGYSSAEVTAILDEQFDIATRSGIHCAPLLHNRFGTKTQGAVRFSFSHFNTEQEIEIATNALKTLVKQ